MTRPPEYDNVWCSRTQVAVTLCKQLSSFPMFTSQAAQSGNILTLNATSSSALLYFDPIANNADILYGLALQALRHHRDGHQFRP